MRGVATLSVAAKGSAMTACQCSGKEKKNTQYAYYSNTSSQGLELLAVIA